MKPITLKRIVELALSKAERMLDFTAEEVRKYGYQNQFANDSYEEAREERDYLSHLDANFGSDTSTGLIIEQDTENLDLPEILADMTKRYIAMPCTTEITSYVITWNPAKCKYEAVLTLK